MRQDRALGVPVPLDDLPGMRLVLLDPRVVLHPDVLVHVEVEQRARLTPRLRKSAP